MNGRKQDNFAGGSPAAGYLSCLAEKGNPKKSPPVCRPSACVVGALAPYNHGVLLAADRGGAQGNEKQKAWCAPCTRFLFCRQRSAHHTADGKDSVKESLVILRNATVIDLAPRFSFAICKSALCFAASAENLPCPL